MAAVFNTIPADDASTQTLLPSKPKTSLKRVVVAAAVASFALGAVFATATQSKVAPSEVAQAAFHSHHHHDPCSTCSMGGCQCWGPETYGCDAGGCDQSGAIASCTKADWPSAEDWVVACLLNNAGVSCKGGNCIQTGATTKGATNGVTCDGGGCVGTPPKPAPAPPKPAPKPPAPPASKPPAPKPAPAQNDEDEDEDNPPAPKPAPAKPTSLFAKPAAPLKTKLCTDPAQIWCIFDDGVNGACMTGGCDGHNMGQPGKHGPVGHPADGDWCTNSNDSEQACKSAPGECTWLTGLPAGSDTCVFFPPGQKPAAAAKPATPKPANGGCPTGGAATEAACKAAVGADGANCIWLPDVLSGLCVPNSSLPGATIVDGHVLNVPPIVLP